MKVFLLSRNVVVVESPAKAKTINKYLGDDFVVLASYGHIRDLPARNGSVDPDNDFHMLWEMDSRSKKHVDDIAKAVKNAKHIYLATDPDREGEAISWHVHQVLAETKAITTQSVERIVFNEITKSAVQSSLKLPRSIDTDLVNAYLARRALDYLVGFNLSPVLWRKLPGAKSAGRVQSVALRLVVDREQEIESFKTDEYWSIISAFDTKAAKGKTTFEARLTYYQKKKLEKLSIQNQEQAFEMVAALKGLTYNVEEIEKKQVKRNPAAPFITSTLQQEASRKIGFGASRTMQIAQKLYEGVNVGGETFGLITYMRTDSVHMSQEAVGQAREFLNQKYGAAYVPKEPRQFKTKAKNAQEAHECIRPTRFDITPDQAKLYLDEAQAKLYELIWKRALASQMEQAIFDQVGVDIVDQAKQHTFRATGSTQVFDGFLKLYQEGRDEPSDEDDEKTLPILTDHQQLDLDKITPNQHFTQPPPRYSEASLVKKLEELGIGRPSTYAPVLQVLQDRQYVKLEKKQFIPEDRGRIVTSFLVHYFPKYVEYDFTAALEVQLDEISDGQRSWQQVMSTFWVDFKNNIEQTTSLTITEVIEALEKDLEHFLYPDVEGKGRDCPSCKTGTMNLKLSKYGAFLGCSNYPECKNTRQLIAGSDESADQARFEDKELGLDPVLGVNVYLKKGPYGFYFEWDIPTVSIEERLEVSAEVESSNADDGKKKKATKPKKPKKPKVVKPKRISLPSDIAPSSVTLQTALQFSKLPYTVGAHPDDGLTISVGYGRFGPYVKHSTIFASIPKELDYLNVDLPTAVDLIEKKKLKPSRKAAKGKTVKEKVVKAAPTKTGAEKTTTKSKAEPKKTVKKTSETKTKTVKKPSLKKASREN